MTETDITVPKSDIPGSIRRALIDIWINRKETIYIVCVTALLFAVMTAPAMAQETICWNDTFDDKSEIAEKNNVTVEGGDVKIDLSNLSVSEWWHSDPLQVAGLGDIGY